MGMDFCGTVAMRVGVLHALNVSVPGFYLFTGRSGLWLLVLLCVFIYVYTISIYVYVCVYIYICISV